MYFFRFASTCKQWLDTQNVNQCSLVKRSTSQSINIMSNCHRIWRQTKVLWFWLDCYSSERPWYVRTEQDLFVCRSKKQILLLLVTPRHVIYRETLFTAAPYIIICKILKILHIYLAYGFFDAHYFASFRFFTILRDSHNVDILFILVFPKFESFF